MIIGPSYLSGRSDIPPGLHEYSEPSSNNLSCGHDTSAQPDVVCNDCVSISPEAKLLAALKNSEETGESKTTVAKPQEPEDLNAADEELSAEEKQEVEKLKERDQEVRRHEQAHLAAAGGLATGGANYKFKTGPDGQQYAVGGEVGLKIPEGGSPEESIRIAAQIERAALAPAEPSSSDRQIAAKARRQKTEAQQELHEQRVNEAKQTYSSENPESLSVKDLSSELVSEWNSESENKGGAISSGVTSIYGAAGISFDRGEISGFDMTA